LSSWTGEQAPCIDKPAAEETQHSKGKKMRKASTVFVLAIAMILTLATVASAGEVKGPPGPGGAQGGATPVNGFWTGDGAASICSFSGLNDIVDEFESTQTQSYGTFLVLVKNTFGLSTHEAKAFLGESPGVECNPNRAPFGNPKK
jgi:hypothetical protein